ncbi:hypothetical protein MNBD_GAMMA16-1968, partial [hydrothermal vent metagenome]
YLKCNLAFSLQKVLSNKYEVTMTTSNKSIFKRNYEKHLQHLTLKGLRPKTIEAYSRGIRRFGGYFNHDINFNSTPKNYTLAVHITTFKKNLNWYH